MLVKSFHVVLLLSILTFFSLKGFGQNIYPDIGKEDGEIVYVEDSLGNKIPDFSYSGYMSSETPIPDVREKIFVSQDKGDATQKIQAALDYVGQLKPDGRGIRGAVLLDSGVFNVSGTLYIRNSGVVLRGSGNGTDGTKILGTGISREAIIRVLGKDDRSFGDTLKLANSYIPLGTREIEIQDSKRLNSGDQIIIRKQLTEEWIELLGMEEFGGETDWIGWKPEDWDITWDRSIESVKQNSITVDAPITMALDGSNKVMAIKYKWPGRIEQVGIENMTVESSYNRSNNRDEQHRWLGINVENAKNAWVRQVNFRHLAGGAVSLQKSTKQVTVEDCKYLEPISEIAAFRRHSFYTEGQQTLFQRCYSENGYHDFAVGGFGTTGPNAFVQCKAYMPYNFSGGIGSWATGVLFDVVDIDGEALSFKNREQGGRGAGWTAANSVLWECSASKIEVYSPPVGQNWAFGVWGQFAGNGHWKEVNSHISPRSLFYAQLEKRFEKLPVDPQILGLGSEPSTSPTLEAAAELTKEAEGNLTSLEQWIDQASERNPIPVSRNGIKDINDFWSKPAAKKSTTPSKIKITNGWITHDGKLITGKRLNNLWWRGSLREDDIRKSTPHITRFVPGRRGIGLTDELEDVVEFMEVNNFAAFEHNYGLWYDRRMDDHERVRRIDADTWPPFYEQPFLRSGIGLAWDHLSKYDLTEYNDWYWFRLKRFAELAEEKGQLLIHQQYFQHNILEAGAHWSSSPWRPANNINNTGFPEPPPYAGDKRIFLAEQFYDVNHPVRRDLHQQYIRKSLMNFEDQSNVIQLTSKEYTGPLHFVQFWLDEVQKWEDETSADALIGLSATKDVQDSILIDGKRSRLVDVIDIRYWYYKEDGSAYAPEGGKNLAPRQHARQMDTGKETAESVYKAIREYRENYPEKAVIYSTNAASRFAWAQLMAGASIAPIPHVQMEKFYDALPEMQFAEPSNMNSKGGWVLENEGESYLFYLNEQQDLELNLSSFSGNYGVFSIDPETGTVHKLKSLRGGGKRSLTPERSEKIIFITKN